MRYENEEGDVREERQREGIGRGREMLDTGREGG